MRRLLVASAVVAAAALAASAGATTNASKRTTAVGADGTFLVNGKRSFPIGLTLPPPLGATTPAGTDALNEVVNAGVTFLSAGAWNKSWTDAVLRDSEAWDSAAAARGVHTWIYLHELALAQPGTAAEAMLRKVVTTLAPDPGFGLWKGADEPWLLGFTPPALQWAYCLTTSRGAGCDPTQALDPNHLWVTIEGSRGTAADLAPYAAVTDTHGVNVYPVGIHHPNPALHRVGTWTQMMASITPNQSVWTTLQICQSGSYDGSGYVVLPTAAQERYMAYDAIINGARALNFFGGSDPNCFSPTDAQYGWNWTFWNRVLKNLLLEIGPKSALYPALLVPDKEVAVRSSDPTTEVIARRVGKNEVWVMAARPGTGSRTHKVTFRGLPGWASRATVYHESRAVTASHGAWSDTFARWAVHVYRFDRPCLVPKVIGKSVAKARHAIKAAHCSVGRVTRVYSFAARKGRVVSQRPRAHTPRRAGAKVSLVVSTGRPRPQARK